LEKYYVGNALVDATWNSASYWSYTSGGTGGAGIPNQSDRVIFDLNSPGCIMDVNGIGYSISTDGYLDTLDLSTYNLDIYYNASFTGGTILGGSGIISTNITYVGNTSFDGCTFTAQNSRIELYYVEEFTSGGQTFNKIEVATGIRTQVILLGGFTASYFKLNPGNFIRFEKLELFEFDEIDWYGTKDRYITLLSTVDGVQWQLKVNATNPTTKYVKVRDSNASVGSEILAM
jgi:hypothetical protein